MTVATAEPAVATAANWRDPPFNRWAFHNVAKIVPVAQIANNPIVIQVAPESPRSFEAFRVAGMDGVPLDIATFLEKTATDAIVIMKGGEIVFERYANGMTRQTPHILMSSTKAMVGLMAGILQRDGDLDLNAPVSRYVPEVAEGGYAGATIRQLIDMRTGILDHDRAAYDAAVSSLDGARGFADLIVRLDAPKPHGGPFSYISYNTDLAGWAMQRAAGAPFADLVSERLWRPMGAGSPAAIITDREGLAWSSGGITATARDFARVGALLLDGGRRDGIQIVPRAWIDDLRDGGDREAWRTGEWGQTFSFVSTEMSYRAGWYSVHSAPKVLFAMGVHGQNLFIDFERGVTIAKLSSQPQRIDAGAIWLTHAALPALLDLAVG